MLLRANQQGGSRDWCYKSSWGQDKISYLRSLERLPPLSPLEGLRDVSKAAAKPSHGTCLWWGLRMLLLPCTWLWCTSTGRTPCHPVAGLVLVWCCLEAWHQPIEQAAAPCIVPWRWQLLCRRLLLLLLLCKLVLILGQQKGTHVLAQLPCSTSMCVTRDGPQVCNNHQRRLLMLCQPVLEPGQQKGLHMLMQLPCSARLAAHQTALVISACCCRPAT